MTANSFKKGSGKDEMARRILESALSTLIAIDTNHNYVLEGSTAANPTLTEAGTKLVASMRSSVRDTAGTIGDAIAGMKKSQVRKSDSIIIYDENSQSNYRITFETLSALIVADAIDNGDVLTTAKLWSHMASNTEYQINISHLRDALADYLTKDKLQGLFRTEGGDAFLSKIFDDEALGVITFLSGLRSNGVAYMMKGLQIGLYQPGITGIGAKIDENGNGEFESLVVRRFLDVPELRYNRVEVLAGDKWRAPGGGIIESVTPDIDPETGGILATGTISLKLEEGEVGCIAVDDICMGIFHDFNDPSNNDDATTDDGFGNRTFAGFCTSYFRITEVTATTNIDGVNYYNKVFRYALRPIGGRWSRQIHPQNFMNFVVYGNFTNTSRQSSTYETTSYTRMLRAQNTWEFSWNNIGMQFGDCSLLANFDTQEEPNERANEASKYLFYIDGDIFHTGVLRRVDSHGRDIIDYYDQGVWDPNTEYFYKDRVYWNGSMWLLVREDTIDDQGVHHGITGSEPSGDNPNWLAVVYSQSVRSMGHWEATKCPYPVSAIVNLAGILYISNKETSNPPRGLLTGKVNGQTTYLKDKDGKYFLIDENEDNISEDWDVLLDIREMVAGEDAIYINLTNDADSIITDINGNIAPGTEYPTTKAQLYQGSIQITSGITWGVSAVGCSASIAPESGTVVTSNMTADKAIVTISATYNNINYQKVFTFSKLFGADKYFLQPSADVIKFNPNAQGGTGEYTPTTLTIRAYVIKGGDKMEITSGAGLGFIRFGGNTYYSGMTVQINNMSVFTSGKLTFELFDNQATPQLQDMEEVPLVQDGLNGSSSATINLTNDTDTVCCDSEGNIDPSDTLPTTNAQLYYGQDKITTGLEWNCNATGCTATIEEDSNNPGEGKLTITAMSADVASVLIFCNFRGEQYSKTFTFKKLFGADKYYLQMSGNAVVMDKTGSFSPNSITARAFCKRFGNDPIECNAQDFPHIKIACQALQQQSGYSPQSVVITDSVFTDRHLVFTLIDDSTPGDVKILDTEDIPLVLDGTDGIRGKDGKDWHYAGMWDSEAEYKAGDVVRMGDTMFIALVDNTNKPPREILKDGVDGKYLKDENDRYLMTGSDLTDDINWDFYFRDGRDGIDGVDGIDGRDGQDGDTPVFVNLTNDTDSVICDMDGNPLEELPTTVAKFFFGSLQLLHEDGVEWSVSHLVGCTLEGETGITDDGYVQVKTMNADRAQVTIRATYKSQYYEKNFNFTKLYGTDKYVLASNFGTVQFNPNNGTYYPTSLVLNAYVVKNGDSIDLTQASGLGYIQIGDDTQHKYYNGDSIQTATFFAVSGIEITLRDPDGVVKDKEYIPRISDGRRGDDGDDAVTMWFDDSNIHFICDAEGTPASGQTYSTTGKLYKGGNDVALHTSLSKAESTTVNCTGVLNVADNTEFILTVTGFKAGATDSNEVRVTLVAADESVSREFIIHVDKIRPGADGKSPVIYNVVPNTNVVNKDKETGVFTPAALTPSVRKSYIDANRAVAHQMLSASQALSSEGIHIYYRFDAMIHAVTEAIGNLDNGNPLTLPSSMNSYVNLAIAKSDGIILDNQSVSAISNGIDGKSFVSRGHWRSGEEYNVGDMVIFAGSIYRCLVASSNIPPLQCLTDNGNFFLTDENGNYLVNYPQVRNTEYWELDIQHQSIVVFDLDNENDSILYDNNGKKISGDVTSNAALYVNGAEYAGPATFSIKAVGCTASISGKVITVSDVTSASGTVAVTCTFEGNMYNAVLSVKRLVGVNKYEIIPSVNFVSQDPNTEQITPENVTFKIYRTDQTGRRTALTTDDLETGDEKGYGVYLSKGGSSETKIAIDYSIKAADFADGDCQLTFYDANNVAVDSETIPVVREGKDGENVIGVDLDNENDTMLYDGAGTLVSGNCISHATLYDGGAAVTSQLTWRIKSSVNVTASISGNTVTVTGISANAGSVVVAVTYKGHEYVSVMSITKIIGIDKYEIITTPDSITYNGNSGTYSSQSIKVDVYRTKQNGARGKLPSTGLPAGFSLKYIGGTGEKSIAPGGSIPYSDYGATNVQVFLRDASLNVIDSENVPVVYDGINGKNGTSFVARGHWQSGTDYLVNEMVVFAGSIYRCIKACVNIPPLQCLTDNGQYFLVDKNGNYLVNYPQVLNSGYWVADIQYSRHIILDLDNENDAIIYDTNGKKVSADVVSHAILYVDGAEYVGAATYGINASGCTATISGRTIIVTGVSGTGGQVQVTCTYDGDNYVAILTVKKLVGTNKYEIVPSENSARKNPNNNSYTPASGITFKIYRTDLTGARRALTADDMNTGDETGFRIGLRRGGQPEATIAIDYTITTSDFAIGDCQLILYDKNNAVLDSEIINVITDGLNGQNSIGISATPSSLIINQDINNTDNIKNPNLSEYIHFYLWKGGENMTANITSIKVNTNGKIYLATETSQTTGSFTYNHPYLIIKGIAKSGDNYYSSAQIGLTVNFTDNGVAKTINYTLSVYINLIGTWKTTIENGAEQKVGERIAYEAGPNGTILRTAWNANIKASATALRSEYTEQIGKAGEYGANLFGFSKGVVFSGNIIPFIQGYGFAQKSAGKIYIHDLGFGGKGGYFTISFYARMSSTNKKVIFKFWAKGMADVYDPDATLSDTISFSREISASTWTRVTQTVYIKSFINDTQRGGQFYVDDAPGDNLLYIRQLKIERGNEATEFTPAAEDLALVGNGQLITSLNNSGMATDRPEINGRRADYYIYVNPSSFTAGYIDYLSKSGAFNINAGKMYTLSFWAKCSSNGMIITTYLYKSGETIITNSGVIYDPGTNGSQMEKLRSDGESKVRLSTAWKQYFIHLYAASNVTGANLIALRVVKSENTSVAGTIYISDIRFVEGFETNEGQYKSLIEQTARRVSISVGHDLLQTGIDITHQKITLRADQVSFTNSAGDKRDKIRIDTTKGTLYAEDGIFNGRIEALTGTIGGFEINSENIKSTNSMVGLYSGSSYSQTYNDSPVRFWAGSSSRDSAPFRVTQAGSVYANRGVIGGFTLSANGLTNSSTQSTFNNDSYIILRNDTRKSFVGIGPNITPAYSSMKALGRFETEDDSSWWGGYNAAVVLRAKNGSYNNFAFIGTGNGVLDGWVGGYKHSKFVCTTANTIYGGRVTFKDNNTWFISSTVSGSGIELPKLTAVRTSLGLSTSTNFCIRLTICADLWTNGFRVCGRNNNEDTSGKHPWNTDELPLMINWNGGRMELLDMSSGDSVEILLVYDSEKTGKIDGYDAKYTARVINLQN